MFRNKVLRFSILGFVVLLVITYYFFEKQQHTKLIGTIDCGLSKIDVRLDIRPNPLEGDGASYEIVYSTSATKNITLGGGPLINLTERDYMLPVNINIIDISTYTSDNSNNDLVLFLPNEKLPSRNDLSHTFSQTEFEHLDSCLFQNIDNINKVLASLPSSVPKGIRDRATAIASAPQLTALVHTDGLQLEQLLQNAGVNYQLVFSSEGDERIIRVSNSGALRFDYYSDVGLDIFSTDFSKPLPEEYEWLNEYRSSDVSLINYLIRIQQKVPITFSD